MQANSLLSPIYTIPELGLIDPSSSSKKPCGAPPSHGSNTCEVWAAPPLQDTLVELEVGGGGSRVLPLSLRLEEARSRWTPRTRRGTPLGVAAAICLCTIRTAPRAAALRHCFTPWEALAPDATP
ncbi:hypothetical protein OsJ_13748 [Oryza sativa Japonica Group]|uniref:Uncharacterized protein n=1 Tax=Oryza sativa subsp. japonica TaxID=39947 RepID=B9FDL1_ORYSJ|nr:hypothetical protein OsJ_13748 [Oryza sativa Japonica Group]